MLEEKPIPWQELLETVYRRRRTILLCGLAGFALALLSVALGPPVFRAEGRIVLTAQPVPGPRGDAMADKQIEAELAFLRSPTLVRSILEDYEEEALELPTAGGPLERAARAAGDLWQDFSASLSSGSPPNPLDTQVQAVIERIDARSIGRSNVVEVAFTASDPEWSARLVNDLLDKHVERIGGLNEQAGTRTFFKQQGELLAERWREAQGRLNAYRERQSGSLLAGDEGQLRRVLSELEANRVSAETEVLELRARVGFLAQEIDRHSETIPAEQRITQDESVRFLKERLLELEIERSELLSRYTPTSTRVTELNRRIEEARRLLDRKADETLEETMTAINPSYQAVEVDLVQTRSQLTAAEARVGALAAQIADYRRKLSSLELVATELQALEDEVANAREAHQTYLRKEEEARFSSALDESRIVNVSIIDRAQEPLAAESSHSGSKLLSGSGIGLLIGLILAFFRDRLDPSVHSRAQAQRLTGLRVVAEIPRA